MEIVRDDLKIKKTFILDGQNTKLAKQMSHLISYSKSLYFTILNETSLDGSSRIGTFQAFEEVITFLVTVRSFRQ